MDTDEHGWERGRGDARDFPRLQTDWHESSSCCAVAYPCPSVSIRVHPWFNSGVRVKKILHRFLGRNEAVGGSATRGIHAAGTPAITLAGVGTLVGCGANRLVRSLGGSGTSSTSTVFHVSEARMPRSNSIFRPTEFNQGEALIGRMQLHGLHRGVRGWRTELVVTDCRRALVDPKGWN
jgi:hypothetical protein